MENMWENGGYFRPVQPLPFSSHAFSGQRRFISKSLGPKKHPKSVVLHREIDRFEVPNFENHVKISYILIILMSDIYPHEYPHDIPMMVMCIHLRPTQLSRTKCWKHQKSFRFGSQCPIPWRKQGTSLRRTKRPDIATQWSNTSGKRNVSHNFAKTEDWMGIESPFCVVPVKSKSLIIGLFQPSVSAPLAPCSDTTFPNKTSKAPGLGSWHSIDRDTWQFDLRRASLDLTWQYEATGGVTLALETGHVSLPTSCCYFKIG